MPLPFHNIHDLGFILAVDPRDSQKAMLIRDAGWDPMDRNAHLTQINLELAKSYTSVAWDMDEGEVADIELRITTPEGVNAAQGWSHVSEILRPWMAAKVRVVTPADVLAIMESWDVETVFDLRDAMNQ